MHEVFDIHNPTSSILASCSSNISHESYIPTKAQVVQALKSRNHPSYSGNPGDLDWDILVHDVSQLGSTGLFVITFRSAKDALRVFVTRQDVELPITGQSKVYMSFPSKVFPTGPPRLSSTVDLAINGVDEYYEYVNKFGLVFWVSGPGYVWFWHDSDSQWVTHGKRTPEAYSPVILDVSLESSGGDSTCSSEIDFVRLIVKHVSEISRPSKYFAESPSKVAFKFDTPGEADNALKALIGAPPYHNLSYLRPESYLQLCNRFNIVADYRKIQTSAQPTGRVVPTSGSISVPDTVMPMSASNGMFAPVHTNINLQAFVAPLERALLRAESRYEENAQTLIETKASLAIALHDLSKSQSQEQIWKERAEKAEQALSAIQHSPSENQSPLDDNAKRQDATPCPGTPTQDSSHSQNQSPSPSEGCTDSATLHSLSQDEPSTSWAKVLEKLYGMNEDSKVFLLEIRHTQLQAELDGLKEEKTQLETSNSTLQESQKAKEMEVVRLDAELYELITEYARVETENSTLQQALESKGVALEAEIAAKTLLETEKLALQQALGLKLAEHHALELKCVTVEAENNDLRAECIEHEASLLALESSSAKLSQENTKLLDNLAKETAGLMFEMDGLKKKKLELARCLAAEKDKVSAMKSRVNALDGQRRVLVKDKGEALKALQTKLELEKRESAEERQVSATRVANLQQQLKQLQKSADELCDDLQSRIDELEAELEAERKERKSVKRELKDLQGEKRAREERRNSRRSY